MKGLSVSYNTHSKTHKSEPAQEKVTERTDREQCESGVGGAAGVRRRR